MKYWLVMKDSYVIARVVWDGVTPWIYPYDYDELVEDVEKEVGVSYWYDSLEGKFKRRDEGIAPPPPPELNEYLGEELV